MLDKRREERMIETAKRQARVLNAARKYREELARGQAFRKGPVTITLLCIAVVSLGAAVIMLILQQGC